MKEFNFRQLYYCYFAGSWVFEKVRNVKYPLCSLSLRMKVASLSTSLVDMTWVSHHPNFRSWKLDLWEERQMSDNLTGKEHWSVSSLWSWELKQVVFWWISVFVTLHDSTCHSFSLEGTGGLITPWKIQWSSPPPPSSFLNSLSCDWH